MNNDTNMLETKRDEMVEQLCTLEKRLARKPLYTHPVWAEAVAINRQLDLIDMELAIDWQALEPYAGYLAWAESQGVDI